MSRTWFGEIRFLHHQLDCYMPFWDMYCNELNFVENFFETIFVGTKKIYIFVK